MIEIAPWLLLAIAFGCGFFAGYIRGYLRGKEDGETTCDGWQDEALWWRDHAATISAPDRAKEQP